PQTAPTTMVTTGAQANGLLLSQDFTLTAPAMLPATGTPVTQNIALPAGTVLPQGAILANGTPVPATPATGLAAPLVLTPGARILGAVTLPTGTVLARGTSLPPMTNLGANMIPAGGAATVMNVAVANGLCGTSGFSDMVIGTKSML